MTFVDAHEKAGYRSPATHTRLSPRPEEEVEEETLGSFHHEFEFSPLLYVAFEWLLRWQKREAAIEALSRRRGSRWRRGKGSSDLDTLSTCQVEPAKLNRLVPASPRGVSVHKSRALPDAGDVTRVVVAILTDYQDSRLAETIFLFLPNLFLTISSI